MIANIVRSSLNKQLLASSRSFPLPKAALAGFRYQGFRSLHSVNKESFVFKYLEEGPKAVKFTSEHEWIALHNDDTAFLGITNYASDALGETTYVELPEVGQEVELGDSIGSVESVKSASEIYTPVEGEVVAINENLESNPSLINEDPMGAGWIAQIKLKSSADQVEAQDNLMDQEQYEESLSEHD